MDTTQRAIPPATSAACILVATKDGSATIARTVASALGQGDVFVVSDGSTDATAVVAAEAGAYVLELAENVGKPAAIYRAVHELGLLTSYKAIAILDDDTVVAPDFMAKALRRLKTERRAIRPAGFVYEDTERRSGQERRSLTVDTTEERRATGVAMAVGKTITDWQAAQRWNPWVASRAYSYWRYQATIRAGQDAFGVLTCISGSNSVYSTKVLAEVLVEQTPYIVDDTYWVLETQRRKLGRVVYAPRAEAWIQDPTTMRDWYKQNLRWLWGTFQGVRGHRIGRERSWFDFWYLTLIGDWLLYVVGWPIVAFFAISQGWIGLRGVVVGTTVGYLVWSLAAAFALRRWRMVALTPAIIAIDVLYRVCYVHALIKAIRQPTVESCRWDSPARYGAAAPPAAATPEVLDTTDAVVHDNEKVMA